MWYGKNGASLEKKSEVDSANASGTQALTLRGLSNPGVLRMGEKDIELKVYSMRVTKERTALHTQMSKVHVQALGPASVGAPHCCRRPRSATAGRRLRCEGV